MPTLVYEIASLSDLNAAIAAVNAGGAQSAPNITYTFDFTADIALDGDIAPLILLASDTLIINGHGFELDGGGTWRGFMAMVGAVTIQNLTIADTLAQGGTGSAGRTGAAGGGAGLGGGLFVGSGAQVVVDNVTFDNNRAAGGSGGASTTVREGVQTGGTLNGTAPELTSFGQGGTGAHVDNRNFPFIYHLYGNDGEFGGGGGGSLNDTYSSTNPILIGPAGRGGFGAGDGVLGPPNDPNDRGGAGGGGLGAGGAVFVAQGGSLTFAGESAQSGGTVAGGQGGLNGYYLAFGSHAPSGQALGTGFFVMAGATLAFAPAAGVTMTIADTIADNGGGLTLNGPGTLELNGANSFTGGITILDGVLRLGNATGAGTGAIFFAGAGTLDLPGGLILTNRLKQFGSDDFIVLYDVRGPVRVDAVASTVSFTDSNNAVHTLYFDPTYTLAPVMLTDGDGVVTLTNRALTLTNLLVDGDFQQVDLSNSGPFVHIDPILGNYTNALEIAVPGWVSSGGSAAMAPTAASSPGFAGSNVAFLVPGDSIWQTITPLSNFGKLHLSFDFASRLTGHTTGTAQLFAGTTLVATRALDTGHLSDGSATALGTVQHVAFTVDLAPSLTAQPFQLVFKDTGTSQLLIDNAILTGDIRPTITTPANQTLEAGTGADFAAASARDADGDLLPALTFAEGATPVASGHVFGLGTHVVTVSATGESGAVGTAQFTVAIVDTTPPVLSAQPDFMVVTANDAPGAAVTFNVTATDIGGITAPVTYKEGSTPIVSGQVLLAGDHLITATAVDTSGNTASRNFTVHVVPTYLQQTSAGTTAQSLSAAIEAIVYNSHSGPGLGNHYVLDLAAGQTYALASALHAIHLKGDDYLTIRGNNAILDGGGATRGLFVYGGKVEIQDLTIQNMLAKGGNGSPGGGGGGAGLGGGLFVANIPGVAVGDVTLRNVSFNNNKAVGGDGWYVDDYFFGGGGGLYGDGGPLGGGGVGVPGVADGGGQSGTHIGGGNQLPNDGGFGGGGGPGAFIGGNGGFGGGGGTGGARSGSGDFGGGGAAGGTGAFGGKIDAGGGGYGGGAGDVDAVFNGGYTYYIGASGGGLGAGGSVFVMAGAKLTYAGSGAETNSTVAGGVGGIGTISLHEWYGGPVTTRGGNGGAIGSGLFLQGDQDLGFAPGIGETIVISDSINAIAYVTSLDAKLSLNGAGTLELGAPNAFGGGITLNAGTLVLGNSTSAGWGGITFAAGATATLKLKPGVSLTNTISGFDAGDWIDVLGFDAAHTTLSLDPNAANTVLLADGTHTLALKFDTAYGSSLFKLASDGSGGTLLFVSGLLIDGDFQLVDLSPAGSGVVTGAEGTYAQSAPFGWTLNGTGGTLAPTAATATAFAGSQVAFLRLGATLSQSFVPQLPYETFQIDLDVGRRADLAGGVVVVTATAGGEVIGQRTFDTATLAPGAKTHLTVALDNLADRNLLGLPITITIASTTGAAQAQVLVDNVVVNGSDRAPAPTMPDAHDQIVEGDVLGGYALVLPIALDAAGNALAVSMTENGLAAPAGQVMYVAAHTVTATTTDAHGQTTTRSYVLDVRDTTAPTLSLQNVMTFEATAPYGAVVPFSVQATDIVDGARVVTFKKGNTVVESFWSHVVGDHEITATASDTHGNTATQTFTIHVVDTTAPVLSTQSVTRFEATSAAGAAVPLTVIATDAVDVSNVVTFKEGNTVVQSGQVFDIGNHEITGTAVDSHGNAATPRTFTISVVDSTAPTLSAQAVVVFEATGPTGAVVPLTVTATDVVDGTDVVTFKEGNTVVQSGQVFDIRDHAIRATAIDAHGNVATRDFTIRVLDRTAPTLTQQADLHLTATSAAGAVATFSVTASDVVDGAPPVIFTMGGREVHSGDVFSVGTNRITATSTDAHGNVATTGFKIFVLNGGSITTAAEMSSAIRAIDEESQASGGSGKNYVLDIAAGATLLATSDIWAVNLRGNDTLTINGHGATLDGNGEAGIANGHRGLFVYSGDVTINDLTIEHTVAKGGNGDWGGGGAAGLGGGLFVANDAVNGMSAGRVTLNNVFFADNQAIGGEGSGYVYIGAGGGMGGNALQGTGGSGVLGASNDFGTGATSFPGTGDAGFGGGGMSEYPGAPAGYGGGAGFFSAFGSGFGGGLTDDFVMRGGGGLGAGGGIFVMGGASLTINGGSLSGGHVAAGRGATGDPAFDAQALGDGIFLEGNARITFAPAAGKTDTISGVIADEKGSGGSADYYGALNKGGIGSLVLDGDGTLVLDAANTFAGGITIEKGTLALTHASAGGTGAITFTAGAETLAVGDDVSPVTVIKGFDRNDTIVLEGITGATVSLIADVNGFVTVTGANGETQTLKFETAKGVPGFFKATPDGHGGTLITLTPIEEYFAANADDLNTFLRNMDAESLLTGGVNGKHYAVTLAAGAYLETVDITAINLRGSDTLTIDGSGATLDGGGQHRGLFVYSGDVTVKDLTLKNMLAKGGDGTLGVTPGGGAAGLGGSLFVANDPYGSAGASHVTLINVDFVDGRAVGGKGGAYQPVINGSTAYHGAGGGMGGSGVLSDVPIYTQVPYVRYDYYSTIGSGVDLTGAAQDGSFGSSRGTTRFTNFGAGAWTDNGSINAQAGFGGGGIGQGGLGAGGNVFVQDGATLTIEGGGTSGGSVAGGTGPYGTGSALGAGFFLEGFGAALTLYATSAHPNTTISDVIMFESPGSALAIGDATHINAGTVTLAAQNTYAGATTVNSGTLLVDGSVAGAVIVKSGGTLGGHGATGGVTVDSGGTFAAGNSAGKITVASLTLSSGGVFEQQIGGTAAGSDYDQTAVNFGAVALNGATLSATFINSFTPQVGQIYRIIDNLGTGVIDGRFVDALGNELAEGASVAAGVGELRISYTGGTGNDVTLTTFAGGVASITTIGANPNNAISDQFTVKFDKRVTGVDIGDFALTTTGSVTGTISAVSAVDGSTYVVTVNGVGGVGTLRLDLKDTDTGIVDLLGGAIVAGGYTAGQRFDVDTVAPSAPTLALAADTGVSGSDKITSDPTITYSTPVPGNTLRYRVDDGTYSTTVPVLADGTHTVSVVEVDSVGNTSPASSLTFTLDRSDPVASKPDLAAASDSGLSNNDNVTGDATPTFTGAAEAGATVTLYDGATVVGTGTAVGGIWSITAALSDGDHVISAQAIDAAGNLGPMSAGQTITIDTVTPDTNITSSPAVLTASTNASFDFTGDDGAGTGPLTFEVQLDGGGFSAASGPQVYAGLSDGSHTFEVRAIDAAGHVDDTPARFTWVIDATAPDTLITTTPDPTSAMATFDFSADDGAGTGVARFEAQLDGGGFATVVSGQSLAGLSEGAHTFEVRAIDNLGNIEATPATYTWIVDTIAPSAPSTPDMSAASDSGKSNSDDLTNVTTPTFTGTAEAGATVRLYDTDGTTLLGAAIATGGVWSITTSTLSEGAHTIKATATDVTGNISVLSDGIVVTIDTTPPAAPVVQLINDTGVSGSDKITGNAAINYVAASGSYKADGGAFSSAQPVFAADGSADGWHTVTVQDEDAAGNISTSILTFLLDTTVPVAQNGAASGAAAINGSLKATDNLSPAPTFSLAGQAAHGMVTVNTDGTFRYTPHQNFSGTDSFTFKANDGVSDSAPATIDLNVTAVHLTGTPGDDSFTALPGTMFIDALGGNDTITFGFRLVDATMTYSGNKVIVEQGSSHTVLTGFERFAFTDGTVDNADGSILVDDLFYYSNYHDVWNAHVDADAHYNATGWHEGRDPNAFFDTSIYLSAYPDVAAAGVNPLCHFDTFGWKEARVPSLAFDPRQYLAANPDVAAANIDPLWHFLAFGASEGRQPFDAAKLIATNGFDFVYYLATNPDVKAAGVDPLQHFQTTGWIEGRNPNALFDTGGYLATYTDVAAANINPLDHYNVHGWHEGRDPSVSFDTTDYLSHNGDVAAAHINPLTHYLASGIHEGRSPLADGVWG